MESTLSVEADEPPAGASPTHARSSRAPALELSLLVLIGFLPALTAGFVYDDMLLIRGNPHVQSLRWLGRAFTTHFWQLTDDGNSGVLIYYRPLVTVSFMVDWALSKGRPWLFHFTNVALHAAATYLVVLLARRLTKSTALALAVAALFAFHPSRTESVEWIAGRSDVMMTVLVLLSVELCLRAASLEDARRRRAGFVLSTAALVLAILCKEAAALMPVVLVAFYLASDEGVVRRRLVLPLAVQGALGALYGVARIWVFPVRSGVVELTPRYGLLTVWAYVERVVLPWPQTFFHRPVEYDAAAGAYVFPTYAVVLGAAVMALYAVFALRTFLADRAAGILAVAAVVTLGPLLNFTYTGIFVTTSDHFLYLPLLLFLLAVARRHRERIAEWAERRPVRLGFASLIAVYAAVDVIRVFDFHDQTSMFEAEVANNPHNPLALKSLAEDRASVGRTDEAFALFLRSSAPESRKYALLMPPWLNYQDYVRLLGLQAARTADGNVSDLMLLYRELLAVLNGGTPVVKGRVGELELGFRPPAADLEKSLLGGGRVSVTAEAALVASRLGDDVRARALLASIGDKYLDVLSNVHNVALAYARLEDFAGARRWEATVMRALPHLYDEHAFDDLEQRLTKAESLFRTAERATGSAQRRLRARAFVELGGYLRALRELRPAYELYPEDGDTGPLYMQLLVASGLVPDARAVAERALGPEAASAMVENTRRALSPRIAKLRRPQGPEDWMTPDPSFQKDEP